MRVGLDVGGTKTDAVAIDRDGRIVARSRHATGWGPDAVAATIMDVVAELAEAARVAASDLDAIGIGMPGQVEPGTARVVHAVNLGVAELDLAAAIGPVFGVPVRAENDVKAAALGAWALHGAGVRGDGSDGSASLGAVLRDGSLRDDAPALRGVTGGRTTAYLNLGTGVAAGIVRDGRLWRGARGVAGEIGHVVADPAGARCRCGQHGCIETLAGGRAIAERWDASSALPVRDVFDAADAGQPRAIALRDGLSHGAAAAIQLLALTVDADLVLLGGGLTALGERLLDPVRQRLREVAASSPFVASLRLDERIELLPAGSPAAALGAALLDEPATERVARG